METQYTPQKRMNEIERTLDDAKVLKIKVTQAARRIGVSRCNIYHALRNGRTTPGAMQPAELLLLREIQKMCAERKALIGNCPCPV